MSGFTLKCASCGANDFVAQGQSLMKCSYCRTVMLVEGAPLQKGSSLKENLEISTRKIETLMRKAANYQHDGVSDGGFLHVTRSELVFIPHAFNVTSGYRLVFPYKELSDIKKVNILFVVRHLVLSLTDGSEATFVMWGRDKLIETVRHQL